MISVKYIFTKKYQNKVSIMNFLELYQIQIFIVLGFFSLQSEADRASMKRLLD